MRKLRELKKGASYKVIATINRFEAIFSKAVVKTMFLTVLKEAKKKFDFHLINFCIADNKCYLIIEPQNDESLSRILQWSLATFAVRYNKRFGIRGHVWYDRFKSKILENIASLLAEFSFMTKYPVKLGLVQTAEEYLFGGVHYIRKKEFDLLDKKSIELYEQIGK